MEERLVEPFQEYLRETPSIISNITHNKFLRDDFLFHWMRLHFI